MRMDQDATLSAYDVVNDWAYEALVKIFFSYGEEKFSKQIARKIEATRAIQPIKTTGELVELIKKQFLHLQDEKVDILLNEFFKLFELR